MTVQSTFSMTRDQIVDRYFLEHRAKLIDIAAFLDRADRAAPAPPLVGRASRPSLIDQLTGETPVPPSDDFRLDALCRAVALLIDGRGDRARRVLELLSDPTEEPIAHAHEKGATGAYGPG